MTIINSIYVRVASVVSPIHISNSILCRISNCKINVNNRRFLQNSNIVYNNNKIYLYVNYIVYVVVMSILNS